MDAIVGSAGLRELKQAIDAMCAAGEDRDAVTRSAPKLYECAWTAREAGAAAEVDHLLDAAYERSTGLVRRTLGVARLSENDREFRRGSIDGLDVRRVDFIGPRAAIPEIGIEIVVTPAGALVPRSTRADERIFATIGAEVQLLAENDLPDEQAAQLAARRLDATHLHGQAEILYGLRELRRLAWGAGFCALTDRRAFGLIFDEEVNGVARSPEVEAMPMAFLDPDGWASVIAFSVERELFEDHESIRPLNARNRPYVNLIGACSIALDTFQVADSADVVVRPRKGEIADAVTRFMAGATDVEKPAPAQARRAPRGGRPALVLAALVVAVLAAAVVLVSRDDEPNVSAAVATPTATATPVDDEVVGEPVTEDGTDGLVTATEEAETPTDDVANTPSPEPLVITVGGIAFDAPEGWDVGAPRTSNRGRMLIRDLRGPDGEAVSVIHTPDFEAKPDPSTVVARHALDGTQSAQGSLVVLENFPTDECRDRQCDDFVLNDPGFGGVAILASDSAGTASEVARAVAMSVRSSGE
jgi:hypothetical protein